MKGRKYAYMYELAVLAEFRRRGVGAALLRKGLDVVDQKGWEAYVDASEKVAGLYRKLGMHGVGMGSG
jgi:ribosomal protein S18 acetylase RimI-like enzyme